MTDMRFRRQLFVGQSASIFATILTAVVALIAITTLTRSADRIATELTTEISLVDQLRLDGERLVSTSRAYLLTGEAVYRTRFRELETHFDSTVGNLSRTSHRGDTSAIERSARDYIDAVRHAAEQRSLAGDPKAILDIFDRELAPKRLTFEREVDTFVHRERDAFEAARTRARRLASRTELTVVVSSLLALGLGIGLSMLFTRTLTRQLRQVEESTLAARRAAASREELTQIVSHDLRSPLQAIVLGTSSLRDALPPSAARALDPIERAAERMTRLIDDLFDRASIERGELVLRRTGSDAVSIARDAVEMFQTTAAERGVTIHLETAAPISMYVDRDRILQVFSNLIDNALRFVECGGIVTVKVEQRSHEVRFTIADTGPGIPADQVPLIFERYYQGENRGTLGLGLHICRLVIEAHHGRIGVDHTPESGAAFWFTVPTGPRYLT